MPRSLRLLATLTVISATVLTAEMKDVSTVSLHSYQLTSSISPIGHWKLTLKSAGTEEQGPTMWLVGGADRKVFIGRLQRDAELAWCPDGRCLLIVEQPSIEDVRLVVFRLGANAERVLGVDTVIRKSIQRSVGYGSSILFYNVRPLKWTDETHVLLAAQARYVKKGTSASAELFTEGYVVDLDSGSVAQRVPAADLKSKYGFSQRIAALRLPEFPV